MANPYFEFQVEAGAERGRFEWPEGATEVVVGRSPDCPWVIASGAVSRRHARLQRQGPEIRIEDLGSSNGTFVNGERLAEPRALHDGDRLQFGSVDVAVTIPPAEPSVEATIAITKPEPPAPPPPPAQPAGPAPGAGTGTRTVTPATESPAAAPTPLSSPAASPSLREGFDWQKLVSALRTPPSTLELAAIAGGSFLLVFAIGALAIRLAS